MPALNKRRTHFRGVRPNMPEDRQAELAKRIVAAYKASGIPAKIVQGKLFIHREEEWEGPLDPDKLRSTYVEEITRIERNVRAAVIECFDRANERERILLQIASDLDKARHLWVAIVMSVEVFSRLGFSEHKSRLYTCVARLLHFRGSLWSQSGGP